MSHTEICPVCEGAGIVNREQLGGAILELNIRCYGCMGKGWVVAPGGKPGGDSAKNKAEGKEGSILKAQTRVVKRVGKVDDQ